MIHPVLYSTILASNGKSYRSSVIQTLHVDEIHVLCLIKTISAVHSPPSLPSGMALYGSQQKAARFSSPPPFLINCSPFHSEPRQSVSQSVGRLVSHALRPSLFFPQEKISFLRAVGGIFHACISGRERRITGRFFGFKWKCK